jgi:glycosyltransferase involved in cell wall biosynthesis
LNTNHLSIIIPHFNSVELLKKLLATIPEKEDLEVIVIDDKSTMGKEEYLKLKEDKDFEHITFLQNTTAKKGAGVCRNIGLAHAQGKWVLFADADDYFTPNMYESVSQYFLCDADVIFFKPTSIYVETGNEANRHKRYVRKIENYLQTRNIKNELELRYRFEVPWSKMIRRTLLQQNGLEFEEVIASNDVMFSAKVGYLMKKFEVSTDIIYVVTSGIESLTADMSETIFGIRFKEKEKYYRFLQAHISKKELDILNISFMDFLLKSRKYGVKKFFSFLMILRQKKLPVFDTRVFNPMFVYRAIKAQKRI